MDLCLCVCEHPVVKEEQICEKFRRGIQSERFVHTEADTGSAQEKRSGLSASLHVTKLRLVDILITTLTEVPATGQEGMMLRKSDLKPILMQAS